MVFLPGAAHVCIDMHAFCDHGTSRSEGIPEGYPWERDPRPFSCMDGMLLK